MGGFKAVGQTRVTSHTFQTSRPPGSRVSFAEQGCAPLSSPRTETSQGCPEGGAILPRCPGDSASDCGQLFQLQVARKDVQKHFRRPTQKPRPPTSPSTVFYLISKQQAAYRKPITAIPSVRNQEV